MATDESNTSVPARNNSFSPDTGNSRIKLYIGRLLQPVETKGTQHECWAAAGSTGITGAETPGVAVMAIGAESEQQTAERKRALERKLVISRGTAQGQE